MGRVADESVAAAWGRRLARQQRSGLPVAEFCRREEVSPASFYQWRRRLPQGIRTAAAGPLFIPVDMPAAEPADGVQIELPGGAIVTLPTAASAALVTTAIRAAMSGSSTEEAQPC